MAKIRIGARDLRALPLNTTLYDTEVVGFSASRQFSEQITFAVRYRTRDGQRRWYKLGRWSDANTADQARNEARKVLSLVAQGRDPTKELRDRREAPTVSDLCTLYMEAARSGRLNTRRVQKQASTLLSDTGRLDRHVKPLLGHMKVAEVQPSHIRKFISDVSAGKTAAKTPTGKKRGMSTVRGGQGVASRTVGLLGAVFTWAISEGMRSDNPVRGVIRPADKKRDRRLSDTEYAGLGNVLRSPPAEAAASAAPLHGPRDQQLSQRSVRCTIRCIPAPSPLHPADRAEGDTAGRHLWPPAVQAIRFLALTGWRLNEALRLRWTDLDLDRRTAILPTTKTGRSIRSLAHQVIALLRAMPVLGSEGLVFPSGRGGPMPDLRSVWDEVMKAAEIPDEVTPHTFRHSFASVAAEIGLSELAIAALLGHASNSVTASYVHHADAVVLAAADRVADAVAERMGDAGKDAVVVP